MKFNRRLMVSIIFYVMSLLLVSGCIVGPQYIPPVSKVPAAWHGKKVDSSKLVTHGWWRNFHDPILNNLIEQRAVMNLDYQMARARIKVARAEYKVAFAGLFPQLSFNALPPDGTGFDLTQVSAINSTLKPDLFGKQRESNHAALANLKVARAETAAALLSLQAEIATSYLALRESQAKYKIFTNNLYQSRQLLGFLKMRQKKGFINYLSVANQDAFIETQLAELEQIKAVSIMLVHKIEILTGNNPGGLTKELMSYKPIPNLKSKIHLGVPAALLNRRPDIVAAEQRVEAAHANIRVAIASLFPELNLGWLFAWQTQSIASFIFSSQANQSTFFATASVPLLNLSLYRMIDVKKRQKALAVIMYYSTVLHALHEVENEYSFYKHYKAATMHLHQALKQKRLVLKLTEDSYRKGAQAFNPVLQAEEDLNHVEANYLHQKVMYETAKINLYKFLGGDIALVQSEKPR